MVTAWTELLEFLSARVRELTDTDLGQVRFGSVDLASSLVACSAKALIQAGLRTVVYQDGYNDDLSALLFEEAGVEVVRIEDQPDLEPTIPFDMNPKKGDD